MARVERGAHARRVAAGHAQAASGQGRAAARPRRAPGRRRPSDRCRPPRRWRRRRSRPIVPAATTRPPAMSTSVSHCSASSKECVVTSTPAPASAAAADGVPQAGAGEGRHARRGLVEHQQLGTVRQRRGEGQSAPQAERQVAGQRAAVRGQLGIGGGRLRAGASVPATSPAAAEGRGRELQVLVDGQVVPDAEALRHVARGGGASPARAARRTAGPRRRSGRSSPSSRRMRVVLPAPLAPSNPTT